MNESINFTQFVRSAHIFDQDYLFNFITILLFIKSTFKQLSISYLKNFSEESIIADDPNQSYLITKLAKASLFQSLILHCYFNENLYLFYQSCFSCFDLIILLIKYHFHHP